MRPTCTYPDLYLSRPVPYAEPVAHEAGRWPMGASCTTVSSNT